MKFIVKIAGRSFTAFNRKDADKLARRYGGKVLCIPVTR